MKAALWPTEISGEAITSSTRSKDRLNRRKHGVSLHAAALLFEGVVAEWPDDTMNHGEERWIALGLIGGRVFTCIYTMRGKRRRFISLRGADYGETEKYYRERFSG